MNIKYLYRKNIDNTPENYILDDISETQGEIFKYVAKRHVDFELFVNNYMNSCFCNKRMDSIYDVCQLDFASENYKVIEKEFKSPVIISSIGQISDITAFNMGFIYRYVSRKYRIPSKELIQLCNYKRVLSMLNILSDGLYTDWEKEMIKMCNGGHFYYEYGYGYEYEKEHPSDIYIYGKRGKYKEV